MILYVLVVLFQYPSQEFVFGVVNSFDDKPVISREIEERAGLSRGTELGKDVLMGQGDKVIGRVHVKMFLSKYAEYPRSIILEFKVVLR